MNKHTATFEGITYKRSSKSRVYTHALVGRRWAKVSRRCAGGYRRQRIETTVDRDAGVNPELELIGWASSRENADKRRATELNAGFAEVYIVDADLEVCEPASPRSWHLSVKTATTNSEEGRVGPHFGEPDALGLSWCGRRRTFASMADAERAGRELFDARKCDAYAVSFGYEPACSFVVRGSRGDYPADATSLDGATFEGSIDERVGPNALKWRPACASRSTVSA